ncbi:MAG: DUF2142 domain-containing protein [Oscillospiraceae bacterium]|nr:DUF2142 domain-containing protein [Oscillospiraceae bacterium]
MTNGGGDGRKGGLFRSRRARTALLALALFLLCVSAHAFCRPFRVDRMDIATVSRLPEDYSLSLTGDDTILQSFCLSRSVERMTLHIAEYSPDGPGALRVRILDRTGATLRAEKRWPAAALAGSPDLPVPVELPAGEYRLELKGEGLETPVHILSRTASDPERQAVRNGEPLPLQTAFTGEYPALRYPVSQTAAAGAALLLLFFLAARRRTSLRVSLFALLLSGTAMGLVHILGLSRGGRQAVFFLLLAGNWILGPWLLARRQFRAFLRGALALAGKTGKTFLALVLGAGIGALTEAAVSRCLNQPFLWGRGAAFSAGIFLILLFVLCGREMLRSPERCFAAVALVLGLYLAAALPPVTRVSWDDQIHYERTVRLSQGAYVLTSDAERDLSEIAFPLTFSQAGLRQIRGEQNALHENGNGIITFSRRSLFPDRAGYLPLAAGQWLGELLGLPYAGVFVLGRMGNVVFFVWMLCLAIRRLRGGRTLLLLLGLLPTVLFLAASYSYDPWVLAFFAVGFAEFFSLLQTPGRTVTRSDVARMVGCIAAGCLPKGIYCLLLLVLLLLPRKKFSDGRSCRRFRVLVLAAVAVLLVYSAAPQMVDIITKNGGGDVRGGSGVNTLAQLKGVLAHPLRYAGVLLRFLKGYLNPASAFEYTSSMAYLGPVNTAGWLLLPVLAAGLLDRGREPFALDGRPGLRLAGLAAAAVQIAAVVTVFYLVFTPVGAESVAGCQFRYLLPLLFPVGMLALHRGGGVRIPPKACTAGATLAGALGAGWTVWALAASRFVP